MNEFVLSFEVDKLFELFRELAVPFPKPGEFPVLPIFRGTFGTKFHPLVFLARLRPIGIIRTYLCGPIPTEGGVLNAPTFCTLE